MTDPDSPGPEQHRHWAVTLFNDVWRLIEQDNRTADQDALMINQAHTSPYHWLTGTWRSRTRRWPAPTAGQPALIMEFLHDTPGDTRATP